jgi:hypothetical protein
VVGDPFYFYNNPNNCYKVTYTVGNPCGSQSSIGYFTNVNFCRQASTFELIEENNVAVSPNPVQDQLSLSFPINKGQIVSLKIIDMHGGEYQLLNNEYLSAGQYDQKFDMSRLPKGIYIYRLETDKITSGKIVKM